MRRARILGVFGVSAVIFGLAGCDGAPPEAVDKGQAAEEKVAAAPVAGEAGRSPNSGQVLKESGARASVEAAKPKPTADQKPRSLAASEDPADDEDRAESAPTPEPEATPSAPMPGRGKGDAAGAAPAAAMPMKPMKRMKKKRMQTKMSRRPMPKLPHIVAETPTLGNTEAYDHIAENNFIAVADDPRSTFSIDVDTASYSNVRRFITGGSLPPADAVRIEEMVNYFSYNYEAPIGVDPFTMNAETSACPWNKDHMLVSIGLQGKLIDQSEVPARNLVFLLDVSGSMNSPDKLPLLKQGLKMLVNNMRSNDKVSIVVYAGASGVVLAPTSGNDKQRILEAMDRLSAGGSTNGGAGIQVAYKLAEKTFIKGGINRVLLATDGDFNVGATSRGDLMRLIEQKRKSGVFLSVLGFGSGNMKDSTMEQIANKGNGNYAYIDTEAEARKVLVEEAGATLVTIAKDVKLQVEFNPSEVANYRLIGYENRKLAHQDFNDDKKDAGEIGAGHSVTALYEIELTSSKKAAGSTDKLKYQASPTLTKASSSGELMNVKIRYKQPQGNKSKLLTFPVTSDDRSLAKTSKDFRFAAAVAQFGMLLRGSKYKGEASYSSVLSLAQGALGKDTHGHRRGFIKLVKQAKRLAKGRKGTLAQAQ